MANTLDNAAYSGLKDQISYHVRIFPAIISGYTSKDAAQRDIAAKKAKNNNSVSKLLESPGYAEDSTSELNEYEINPEILSISTNKEIDNPCGSWTMEFNYRQGEFDDNGWFMKINPMDYVEIYMKRGSSYVADYSDNFSQHEIGIYTIKDPSIPPMFHTDDNLLWKGNFEQGKPLGIENKSVNPDLIMSGYVDTIENKYSVSATGANNRIVISGRCVNKFLQVHEIFRNQIDPTILTLQSMSALAIPNLKCVDVIDFILFIYLLMWIANGGKFAENVTDTWINSKSKSKNKEEWIIGDVDNPLNTLQINLGTGKRVIKRDYESISKFIYWAIARPNPAESYNKPSTWFTQAWWARLEDNSPNELRASVPFDEGKLWEMLIRNIDTTQNEFWGDEAGNLVLRKRIHAWTQPDPMRGGTDYFGANRGLYYNDRPWVKITSDEILNWNIKKTDNELKTVITIHPLDNIMYQSQILSASRGQAPLTSNAAKVADTIVALGIKDTEAANIASLYLQNIGGYNLKDDADIHRFWINYGIRHGSYGNQYSGNSTDFYVAAMATLEMFGSLWFSGEVTVRGNSKYKLGRMLYIQDLNLEFYISGVSHKMQWGESWSTTLKLTRGAPAGSIFDPSIQPRVMGT